MKVKYEFRFADGKTQEFVVDTEREVDDEAGTQGQAARAEWVHLDHCRCSNCPLAGKGVTNCPVAVDLEALVDSFKDQAAFQKVDVTVSTPERSYSKHTSLEEALRSLLGLVMATSDCPLLSELRPMAIHHMPFATNDEFILRSVSIYLVQQYFAYRAGAKPDWELKGLVERNRQLQLVNQALWQRIHSACERDANLKALLSFFSMASSVTFSLEAQLQKLRHSFEAGEWNAPQI